MDFFFPFLAPPPPEPAWAAAAGGGGAGREGETGPAAGLGGGRGGGVEERGSRSEDMEWRLASEVRLFLAGRGGGGNCGGNSSPQIRINGVFDDLTLHQSD